MLKNLFTYLLIVSAYFTFAQTAIETELDSITTFDKAQEFLKNKTFKQNKLIVFNEEKHKTTLAKELFTLSLGATKTYDNDLEKTIYKVLEKSSTPNYRVSYIVLKAGESSISEINVLRDNIIKKYHDGASFNFLARQYSMDMNAKRGGDTGWFSSNFYDADLEAIVLNDQHQLEDIFTADASEKQKYYVILKTYEPKDISEIKVLKIVDDIE